MAIESQLSGGVVPYATRYQAALDDCSITWIAYDTELDRGVVKHQASCPAPLAEQLPLMKNICASFLGNDRNAPAFRLLFWGTLFPDNKAGSWEMSFRLAVAAFHSSEWDTSRGKPSHGDLNRFTKELANRALIYPELKELFAGFNRAVILSHVEKVLVLPAAQLPYFPQLERLGIKAADRLPFDCMAWFAITADVAD